MNKIRNIEKLTTVTSLHLQHFNGNQTEHNETQDLNVETLIQMHLHTIEL